MPGQPFGGPLQSPGPGEGTAGPQGVLSNPHAQGFWKLQTEKQRASPCSPFCRPSLSMPSSFSAPCLSLPLSPSPHPACLSSLFFARLPLLGFVLWFHCAPLFFLLLSPILSISLFWLILKLSPFASPLHPPPLSVSICFSLSIAPDPGSPDCCPPTPSNDQAVPLPLRMQQGRKLEG